MSATPGYDRRIAIRIAADKNGRLRATYWSMRALRNLPLKLADAELFITMDQADREPVTVNWTPDAP